MNMVEDEKKVLEGKITMAVDTKYNYIHIFLENTLEHVELLHIGLKIHRNKVDHDKKVLDGKLVPLVDE